MNKYFTFVVVMLVTGVALGAWTNSPGGGGSTGSWVNPPRQNYTNATSITATDTQHWQLAYLNYSNMFTGAGTTGRVTSSTGHTNFFLRGDGIWTNASAVNALTNGSLISALSNDAGYTNASVTNAHAQLVGAQAHGLGSASTNSNNDFVYASTTGSLGVAYAANAGQATVATTAGTSSNALDFVSFTNSHVIVTNGASPTFGIVTAQTIHATASLFINNTNYQLTEIANAMTSNDVLVAFGSNIIGSTNAPILNGANISGVMAVCATTAGTASNALDFVSFTNSRVIVTNGASPTFVSVDASAITSTALSVNTATARVVYLASDYTVAAPSATEAARVDWVRSLTIGGQEWYMSSVVSNFGGIKTTNFVALHSTNSTVTITNSIASPVASATYLMGGISTQIYGQIRSPVTFEMWTARVGGNSSTVIPAHPEVYYVYQGSTNHLGDWSVADQNIANATLTKMAWSVHFTEPTITGAVRLIGYLKSGTVSGTAAGLNIVGGDSYNSHLHIDAVSQTDVEKVYNMTNMTNWNGSVVDGNLNLSGNSVSNGSFIGNGFGLTNIPATGITETDTVFRAWKDGVSIAAGSGASAIESSVAIAGQAYATNGGVAIGGYAVASNASVAIGMDTIADQQGIAMSQSAVSKQDGIALGFQAYSGYAGMSIGRQTASSNGSITIGMQSHAYGDANIAIGGNNPFTGFGAATVPDGFTYTTEIGYGAATNDGWMHYRGNAVIAPDGSYYGPTGTFTAIHVSGPSNTLTGPVYINNPFTAAPESATWANTGGTMRLNYTGTAGTSNGPSLVFADQGYAIGVIKLERDAAGAGDGDMSFMTSFGDGGELYPKERMRIVANGGKVGIGTANPSSKLDVVGTITATAFSGNGGGLTNVAAIVATTAGAATNLLVAGNLNMAGFGITNASSVTVGAFTSTVAYATNYFAGNIQIGTATEFYDANFGVNHPTLPRIVLNHATSMADFNVQNVPETWEGTNTRVIIRCGIIGATPLRLQATGIEFLSDYSNVKAVLSSAGYLGIATNLPATPLDVAGAATFRGNINMAANSITNIDVVSATSITGTSVSVNTLTGGTVIANGNVSVGTNDTTLAKVVIDGNSSNKTNALLCLSHGNYFAEDNASSEIILGALSAAGTHTGTGAKIATREDYASGYGVGLSFFTHNVGAGNTEALTITKAANVGIGTNIPATKLDVNGAATIRGNVNMAGNAITNASFTGNGAGLTNTPAEVIEMKIFGANDFAWSSSFGAAYVVPFSDADAYVTGAGFVKKSGTYKVLMVWNSEDAQTGDKNLGGKISIATSTNNATLTWNYGLYQAWDLNIPTTSGSTIFQSTRTTLVSCAENSMVHVLYNKTNNADGATGNMAVYGFYLIKQ